MEIALIKSYTEKPWRSPETYQLIEDSLREKWRVQSIHTQNPETLYGFLLESWFTIVQEQRWRGMWSGTKENE